MNESLKTPTKIMNGTYKEFRCEYFREWWMGGLG